MSCIFSRLQAWTWHHAQAKSKLKSKLKPKPKPDSSPRLFSASHSSPLPTMPFTHLSLPAAIVLLVTGYLLFVRWLLSLMGRSTTEKTSP